MKKVRFIVWRMWMSFGQQILRFVVIKFEIAKYLRVIVSLFLKLQLCILSHDNETICSEMHWTFNSLAFWGKDLNTAHYFSC